MTPAQDRDRERHRRDRQFARELRGLPRVRPVDRPEGYRHQPGPNLTALYAERRPGCCLGCDEPLPPRKRRAGRVRVLCGAAACERLYQAAYRQDRSLREGRKGRGWVQREFKFQGAADAH